MASVTLCRRSAKKTIPLSVLARNQTKGFGLEISGWPEVGKGIREGSWTKGLEEGSWRRTTDRAVDTGQQRDELAWERVQSSEEDRSGKVGIPNSFVEVSLEIHASVSLHMHSGNAECCITPCLALWVNPRHIVRLFVCSFSPTPSIVFLIAIRNVQCPYRNH